MSHLRIMLVLALSLFSLNCFSYDTRAKDAGYVDVFTKYSIEVKNYTSVKTVNYKKANKVAYKKPTRNKNSKRALANIIYCENNASEKSMRLVASTIHNRYINNKRSSYESVIYRKNQYACSKIKLKNVSQARYKIALEIADEMLSGVFKPTTRASYFYSTYVYKKPPKWVKNLDLVLKFEGHAYYV